MRKLKDLSLSIKLSIAVGLVLIVVFGMLIMLNLSQLKSVSMSEGELDAIHTGQQVANQFQNDLTGIESTLSTLRDTLLDARSSQSLNREEIVRIFKNMMETHPSYLGLYTLWEPNAFDNNDRVNQKKTAYDDVTGRFLPYVVRTGDKINVEPLADYDKEGAGDYYLIPKKTKQSLLKDPYLYQINGKDTLMTSIVLPILDSTGQQFLGIVGVDLSLDTLQKLASQTKVEAGYITIVSSVGSYIAHSKRPELINQTYADRPEKEQVWKNVQGGNLQGYSNNEDANSVFRDFLPINLKGSTIRWYIETVTERSYILDGYQKSMWISLSIALGAFVVLALVIIYIVRVMVVRSINSVIDLSQQLAGGDFTRTLPVTSQDEFGRMAQHFNGMIGNLRELIQKVTDHSMSVGATSEELTASAEQTSRAAETIAVAVQDVAASMEVQEQNVKESTRAMFEMSAGIERIAESSSSVADSSQSVAKQTSTGYDQIQDAIRQMNVVQGAVSDSETIIRRLGDRSDEIGSIIGIITNISAQTNLLALNASIEAARVGEQGRGFAVVASEIRKLAEQTKDAATQVATLIGEIRTDTHQAVETMGRGSVEVNKGVAAVQVSGETFSVIREEMDKVSGMIQEVSAAAEQISASSEQVTATVDQLSHIATDASENAQSVAAASEEQLATMEEISASSAALSHMVQELLELMARFKV